MPLQVTLEPAWQITLYYIMVLLLTSMFAKLVSAFLSNVSIRERIRFLVLSPTLSFQPWSRNGLTKPDDLRLLLMRLAWLYPSLAVIYFLFPSTTSGFSWSVRGYLAIVPFWLITEAIGSTIQFIYALMGISIAPMHDRPWRSRSLAEFWGRRWNRLHGDWFRESIFNPMRRRGFVSLVVVFFVSGLLHEILVNIPMKIVYGTNLLGSMMIYFLLQAAGILIGRKWLRQSRLTRTCFLWITVLGPVPLVLNEATLRIFHFAE